MLELPLLTELAGDARGIAGGKGAILGRLLAADQWVPLGFIIPAAAFEELGPRVTTWPADAIATLEARVAQVAPYGAAVAAP